MFSAGGRLPERINRHTGFAMTEFLSFFSPLYPMTDRPQPPPGYESAFGCAY
jgi:hypothetical protein